MPDFSNRLLARFAGQRFSYRWYSDIQLARQGIVLEQNKEPALSGGIQRIEPFVKAGADLITFHLESDSDRSRSSRLTAMTRPSSWRERYSALRIPSRTSIGILKQGRMVQLCWKTWNSVVHTLSKKDSPRLDTVTLVTARRSIGQNYLRSLFALGFQGFLIIICVGIYAVLVQSLAFTDDIIADIWGIMGYTVLLCFTLFKTGTLAKSVFNAH